MSAIVGKAALILAAIGLLHLPVSSASLHRRILNDPSGLYLNSMCSPLESNATYRNGKSIDGLIASLANSPFPCEKSLYILSTCEANGTEEVDFLAEQQCLCTGAYWELLAGCDACLFAHGWQRITPDEAGSSRSSLSLAECTPTPPFQPYSNLLPSPNISTAFDSPPLTLGIDKFPNDTATSNYFTSTLPPDPGSITGSATARQTSWTNYNGSRYSASTPAADIPQTTTSSSTAKGSSTPSGSGSGSSNGASIQSFNWILAAGLGFVAVLA